MSLSTLTNQSNPIGVPFQPLFLYKIITDFQTPGVIEGLVDSLIAAQMNNPNFNSMWKNNITSIFNGFTTFFRNNDGGVAFNFVSLGLYPGTLNRKQWGQYFKGSEKGATGFVEPDPQQKIAVQKLFTANLYANTEKVVAQQTGLKLTNALDIDKLYGQADYVFKLLKEYLGQLEIKKWDPVQIGVELSRLHDGELDTNAFYIDFVLRALYWINSTLQSKANVQYGYSQNYAGLYDFLNSPSRIPSDIMVSIQMDSYRMNPLTMAVDQLYRGNSKKKGLLQQKWPDNNTPSWAIVSWILYYVYSMFQEYEIPSMTKYSEGLKVSMRVNKALTELTSKGKKLTTYNSDITKIVDRVLIRSGNSEESQIIKEKIIKGTTAGKSDPDLWDEDFPRVGLSNHPINYANLGDLIFEEEDFKVYRSSIKGNNTESLALAEMGKYLGHCKTDDSSDFVYSVFIDDIPYYTISTELVTGREQINQFKGLGNRSMGFTQALSKTPGGKRQQKISQRAKSKLALDDAYNVLRFLKGVPTVTVLPSDTIIQNDLGAVWNLIKKQKESETFSEIVYNVLTSR